MFQFETISFGCSRSWVLIPLILSMVGCSDGFRSLDKDMAATPPGASDLDGQTGGLTLPSGPERSAFTMIQAESFTSQLGSQTNNGIVGYLDAGDYLHYRAVGFEGGARSVSFLVAVPLAAAGKKIDVRLDSMTGPLVGTLTVQNTGGWSSFATQGINLTTSVTGVHDLYLVMSGGADVANIDSFIFSKQTVATPAPTPTPTPTPTPEPPSPPSSPTAEQTAWVEGMIYDARNAPDFSTLANGGSIPAYYGGHLITSFSSIQDFMSNWSTSPPYSGIAPGGSQLRDLNAPYPTDPQDGSRFTKNVAAVIPWLWTWAANGHASTNAAIEARNMYVAAKRKSTGKWEYFFSGARPGNSGTFWNGNSWLGGTNPGVLTRYQADGISTLFQPKGNYGIEVWPTDTVPSRGIRSFYGAYNRSLMEDAECFIWGVQVRIVLADPSGPNDIAKARFGMAIGADFGTSLGGRHYDRYGFPYNMADGGHDRWKIVTSTNWTWVTSATIGDHWMDPGTPPPLASWDPPTPFNNLPRNAITSSELRANPPPLPPYR